MSSNFKPDSSELGDDRTDQVESAARHQAIYGEQKSATVTMIAGPALGRRFEVDDSSVVVGRSSKADVQIQDRGISRKHFRLTPDGPTVLLEDLDSSNGTFVNGERIEGSCTLNEGDNIAVGLDTALRISWLDSVTNFEEAFSHKVDELRESQQRLRDELDAARDVQRSLLPPKKQRFPNIFVEGLYHPSGKLSGDFYDILYVEPWVYLYVVDVTSHGVASAQVTYLLRGSFTQLLHSDGLPVDELLRGVQKQYQNYDVDYDAAYHVCRVNTKTGEGEYLRASVLPGFLKHGGRVDVLQASPSMTLSQIERDQKHFSEPTEFQLHPGDRLILCTDGCYEFRDRNGREFGSRRLLRALQQVDASNWSENLMEMFAQVHGDREFPDDLTAVRVKFEAGEYDSDQQRTRQTYRGRPLDDQ